MLHRSGRRFLQIPGPTNVPDRVLRAMAAPTIDHRGPAFRELTREVLAGMAAVVRTRHPVVLFPASGTGAWEAALANTLSPGDRVLMVETGHFATLWKDVATRLGLDAVFARHGRHAEAARRAARAWGLELLCVNPSEYSSSLTAVLTPRGHDAARLLDTARRERG